MGYRYYASYPAPCTNVMYFYASYSALCTKVTYRMLMAMQCEMVNVCRTMYIVHQIVEDSAEV